MFCPNCRDEFQDWVKMCPDCHVNLVDNLPPSSKPPAIKRVSNRIHEVHQFIKRFTFKIDRRGLIISVALILALTLMAGVAFFLLGVNDGLARGKDKTKGIIEAFIHICKPELGTIWWEIYQKQDIATGMVGTHEQLGQSRKYITNDLARAQENSPFQIIIPSYVPSGENTSLRPMIEGCCQSAKWDTF